MKGSSWEDFQPGRKELAHLGKMTRGKAAKSWVWKRWEALKEEGTKVSFLRIPQNGKSVGEFWGKSTKRRKLWEIRKGSATNVAGTTLVLLPKRANRRNLWYPGTLGWHYKRRKGIQQRWIRVESLRKLC